MASDQSTRISPSIKDLRNQKFGKLEVIRFAGYNKWGSALWICRCECGNEKTILGNSLTRKNRPTVSCGCHAKSRDRRKHGMSFTPTYSSWGAMIKRCRNPKDPGYPNYGGRGIKVCERWDNKQNGFQNFLADMGERPGEEFSIDRKDSNGDYTPDNCRWATVQEQAWNRRTTDFVEFNGERLPVSEWARRLGVRPASLKNRLKKGWSIERALTEFPNTSRDRVKLYEHDGKKLSLPVWATNLGMNYQTLRSRIVMGWTFEEAISIEPVFGNKIHIDRCYEHDGKTMNLAEWARFSGISRSCIQKRLALGWSFERAVTTPPDPKFIRRT